MGQDDRRKFDRFKKQSIINFQIIETPEKESDSQEEALMVDCSEGGIRFSGPKALKKNTKIYIKIKSEDWGDELTIFCQKDKEDLFQMIGSVMWCLENEQKPGEFEIGTQFVDMQEN